MKSQLVLLLLLCILLFNRVKKDSVKVIYCCLICALLIIVYSNYRCKHPDFQDPIQKHPFGKMNGIIGEMSDGWSISHFLFFALLGYKYPSQFRVATLMGLLWEGFEWCTSNTQIKILSKMRGLSLCHSDSGEHWWYSKYTDIIMNISGFLIGKAIRGKN